MSCAVGRRCSLDTMLLWLWHRPAAVSPIGLLAWEPPYAMGAALEKRQKDKKKIIMKNKSSFLNQKILLIPKIMFLLELSSFTGIQRKKPKKMLIR